MKQQRTYIIALCAFLVLGMYPADNARAIGVYQNFDNLPVTGENEIPGDGGGWKYSSGANNTGHDFYGSCGYWNSNNGTVNDIHEYFYFYVNNYNNEHMGYTSFQYIEIDNENTVKGNSLKVVVTGGKKEINGTVVDLGNRLLNKQEYLDYLSNGEDPVYYGPLKAGQPNMYFMNSTISGGDAPFPVAAGANRYSFYLYIPDSVDNGVPTSGGNRLDDTFGTGPYTDIGGHFYHNYYTRGGGWTHVIQDSHPQHNNAWGSAARYPYPSYSIRDYGTNYYNSMWRTYWAVYPITGIDIPNYSIWLDEMEYIYDPEPQNNETINSPSVLYKPSTKSFEIGFYAKYKNNVNAKRTYQVRYSFSPINNSNWDSAQPVLMTGDNRFGDKVLSNTDGIVKKINSYYPGVWAPFKVIPEDEVNLTPGTTIYFAIKDLSQNPNNLQQINPLYNNGTDYANHMSEFDFAGDAPALPLIKRIDYYIAGEPGDLTAPPSAPAPVILSIQDN